MRWLRRIWRYLTGPVSSVESEVIRLTRERSRRGLVVARLGDGTACRDYEEAA